MPRMFLKNSNFVMTGASSGIGAEFLKLIEPHADSIVTLGRTTVPHKNEKFKHFKLDFSKPFQDQWDQSNQNIPVNIPINIYPKILTNGPENNAIDALVLCSGSDVNGRQPFLDQPFSVWENTLQVNFLRPLELIHTLLPRVLSSRLKTILFLTSTNVRTQPKNCTAYTSAKAALQSALDNIRKEYASQALRVIEVIPGITKTNFAYNRSGDRTRAHEFYESFSSTLDPLDVATSMFHALNLDPKVSITRLEIQPTLGEK